jgi:hypothetical protein
MATYVLILNGKVHEVLVADEPSPLAAPYAWVEAPEGTKEGYLYDGSAFSPPAPVAVSPAQLAQQALVQGVQLISASAPELNGVYSVDATSQMNITSITTYVLLNGEFPGHRTTLPWVDMSGTVRLFPSVGLFKAFATEVANYAAVVSMYGYSNGAIGALLPRQIVLP